MRLKNFLSLFKESAIDFYKYPIIVIPSLALLLLMIAFSNLSVKVNYSLSNTLSITSWLVFFVLVSLLVISYFLSGIIALSRSIIERKFKIKMFFNGANKYWIKNFLILLVILIIFNIINVISYAIAFSIGRLLNLSIQSATLVFFILMFVGIATILLLFTFSSFSLVLFNPSIKESIKKSFKIVGKNYTYILSVFILLFMINELLSLLNSIVEDIIKSALLIPYLMLFFTRLVLTEEN